MDTILARKHLIVTNGSPTLGIKRPIVVAKLAVDSEALFHVAGESKFGDLNNSKILHRPFQYH